MCVYVYTCESLQTARMLHIVHIYILTHYIHAQYVHTYCIYTHTVNTHAHQYAQGTVDNSASTLSATDVDSSWTLLGSDCVCCNVYIHMRVYVCILYSSDSSRTKYRLYWAVVASATACTCACVYVHTVFFRLFAHYILSNVGQCLRPLQCIYVCVYMRIL